VSPLPPIRDWKLCYVTDRKSLAGSSSEQISLLLGKMEAVGCAGVDWIQIREKDLSGCELVRLASEAVRRVPGGCRILVNDRMDVARAAGAHGAHLGEQSLPVEEAKRLSKERNFARQFLIGASTHDVAAAVAAEQHGADYVVFGPVFETPSKIAFGPAQGIERLAEACSSVSIPVIAIGGVTLQNARECAAAGAAGIAAIRLFQDAADVAAIVRQLRRG